MKLIIVESPAKCKKIESFLGNGYKCIASFGHITELNSLDQININQQFVSTFNHSPSKKKQIALLKKQSKLATEVILATDDDREGEAIAWHICQICRLPVDTTKRIVFHEITKPAVCSALAHPVNIKLPIVYAQHTRQIVDLLIGFTISPILWKHIRHGLSAGRCQTPALRMVYENDVAERVETFDFDICGYFTTNNIKFTLSKTLKQKVIKGFLEACKTHSGVYSLTQPKKFVKEPPTPLITSSIQQKANNLYHYSPKQTMSLCQTLYEAGLITYMRTDSPCYSEEFIHNAEQYVSNKWSTKHVHPNINLLTTSSSSEKTLTQDAHEAIRPTNIELVKIDDPYSPQEQKLYQLIWSHSVESVCSPAEGLRFIASVTAPDKLNFKYTSETITWKGWLVVQWKEPSPYSCIHYQYLRQIKQGPLDYKKIIAQQNLKGGKSHYSEAQLIQQLEKNNIGRPSTFSSIVEKLKDKKYVLRQDIEGKTRECIQYELISGEITEHFVSKIFQNEKNKLVLQPLGREVSVLCDTHFNDLFNYSYTEQLENELDEIILEKTNKQQVCQGCYDILQTLTQSANTTITPKIQNDESRSYGDYKNQHLYIKKGAHGYYAVYGKTKTSIQSLIEDKPKFSLELLSKETLVSYIENKSSNVLRVINTELSIRKSKHGEYIFYKTSKMKKPKFMSLKNYTGDYMNDNTIQFIKWLNTTYKLSCN